jgi:hypothetical protein
MARLKKRGKAGAMKAMTLQPDVEEQHKVSEEESEHGSSS